MAREGAAGSAAELSLRACPYGTDPDYGPPLRNILSEKEQAELARIAVKVTYPRRRSIFHEGTTADSLFAVARGIVEVSRQLEDGDRQVLAFFQPGDLLGLAEAGDLLGLAGEGRYLNTAYTLTPATLFRFPLHELRALLLADSQLQLHLLLKTAHELRTAQHQLIILTRTAPKGRFASFLLDFTHRLEFFDPQENIVFLPMTRSDIADYLAVRPETLARALTTLERDRIIKRLSGRRIRIRDLGALIRLSTP